MDIMYTILLLDAAGPDARLAAPTDDVLYMNILEFGHILQHLIILRGRLAVFPACGFIEVVTLEHDGLVLDIIHDNIRDEKLLSLSASTYRTFEAQASIRTGKAVVPHYDAPYATRGIASQHESPMRMEDRVVLDHDILATIGRRIRLRRTALHAYPVITSIDHTIHDQADIDIREINGIAVLCIPRTAHRHAVDDHVAAVAGMHVETRSILHRDPLDPHIHTIRQADQVVSQALLLFG